jgi:hypothetical protein
VLLNPFEPKKRMEAKLKTFFTALRKLDSKAAKP